MKGTKTEYRRQHWLPLSYLKVFTHDPTVTDSRKVHLYRFDGKNHGLVSAKSQCYGNYFYSQKDPKWAESDFHRTENDFPKFVKKLQSGQSLTRREECGMIFNMFLMHFRNASYENRTGEENIQALHQALCTFLEQEISEISGKAASGVQETLKGLTTNWRLQQIVSQEEKFITSDHPVVLFSLVKDNRVVMAALPVAPHLLALAYDRRKIAIKSNKATSRDVAGLNAYVARQSIAAVYSAEEFSLEDQDSLKKIFAEKRRTQRGYFDKECVSVELITYNKTPDQEFSFLEVR